MEIIDALIEFFFGLFTLLSVPFAGYTFSLGGAIIFAGIVVIFLGFLVCQFRRILFLVDRTSLGKQATDVFEEVKLEELMTLDDIYNLLKFWY